jgi:hypothetical protein
LLIGKLSDNAQAGSAATLYVLQLLHVFLARHHPALPSSVQSLAFQSVKKLISQADASVQSWALVTLGLLATFDVPDLLGSTDSQSMSSPSKRRTAKLKETDWSQLWSFALRNLSSKTLARASAQFCYNVAHEVLVLGSKEHLLGSTRIITDLENLCKDFQMQVPSFPADSVCNLFSLLASLSRTDVRLYKAGAVDKVVGWLAAPQWAPLDKKTSAAKCDRFDVQPFLSLLLNCVDGKLVQVAAELGSEPVWPRCELARTEMDMEETRLIHEFVADARMPVEAPSRSTEATMGSIKTTTSNATPTEKGDAVASSLLSCLQRMLEPLAEKPDGISSWLPASHERLKRVLEWCSLFLIFYSACFTLRRIAGRPALLTCNAVLLDVVPQIHLAKWTDAERYELLQVVGLVFLPLDLQKEEVRPPCRKSGLADPHAGVCRHCETVPVLRRSRRGLVALCRCQQQAQLPFSATRRRCNLAAK